MRRDLITALHCGSATWAEQCVAARRLAALTTFAQHVESEASRRGDLFLSALAQCAIAKARGEDGP